MWRWRLLMLVVTTVALAGTERDRVSFAASSPGTLLADRGWGIAAAVSGGWGRFPQHYTYRVVDLDGDPGVVGSYGPAQNHAHSSAIPIDWDGDPANGLTPLELAGPTTITIGISAYLQPYAKGWRRAGTGRVIWRFGPGTRNLAAPAVQGTPEAPVDWAVGRGPRFGYRLGREIDGREIEAPEVLGYAPAGTAPATQPYVLPATGTWYDMRLTIAIDVAAATVTCTGDVRLREGDWEPAAAWSFRLGQGNAADPRNWNVLFLDQPLGIWSRQGYGEAVDSMRDRYDNLELAVTAANRPDADARLLAFDRLTLGGSLQGPPVLFMDEPSAWQWRVANAGAEAVSGDLAVDLAGTHDLGTVAIPGDSSKAADLKLGPLPAGSHTATLVLAGKVLTSREVVVLRQPRPTAGRNLLRNGSFELDRRWNGTFMHQGAEPLQTYMKAGKTRAWTELPIEAWWAEGPVAPGIETATTAHSGARALRVTGTTVVSALDPCVGVGPVTLSAWVRPNAAEAALELHLLPLGSTRPEISRTVTLPQSGDWQRVHVTVESQNRQRAVARLAVTAGSVLIDDMQLENATTPTTFHVRPAEALTIAVDGVDPAALPKWVAGDPTPRTLVVSGDGPAPPVEVWLGPWNAPKTRRLGVLAAVPGRLEFSTADLAPNAYVITLACSDLDGATYFNPTIPVGGRVSWAMTAARCALRFAIAPDYTPGRLFGVGNGMLGTGGSWWGGWPMEDYLEARRLGLTASRGSYSDDIAYLNAAGALPVHVMRPAIDAAPEGATFANPGNPRWIDIHNPDGRARIMADAERTGRECGADPFVATLQLANEQPYANKGAACPSVYADRAFRAWCRTQHPNLTILNERWGAAYTDWGQVEQLVSARFVELARSQPRPEGAAAIDWTASTGRFSPELIERMQDNPGQAMDWLRWRTAETLRLYAEFRERARQFDRKTLYSTNLCWPSFWPQMFMPLVRAMDVTMLDCQYTSGLPRALGNPAEMMDIMEMAESTDPTKPLWGIEVYVQPQWPAEFTALQNWGMVAHGMTNNLVFAWKPYSDHGRPKGNRAWEKADATAMWYMIDNDGTRLPNYTTYVRSVNEIHDFHARFNGFSLHRAPTSVALYVAADTNELVLLETGNKPWESMWQRTRNNLVYLLRLRGITADYVDDTTLPAAPGRFRTIIVPASPVLSAAAAARLAAFARAGGTVVLAGICGQRDPWLRPYRVLGGPGWEELGWTAPDLSADKRSGDLRGRNAGTMRAATAIVDDAGEIIGWQRPWGRGRLIATVVFPDAYTTSPHPSPQHLAWVDRLIELAELPTTGRWQGESEPSDDGRPGTGTAVVEVVVRHADNDDRFVFVLNQGGPGQGAVEIPLPAGNWQAENVLTGESVPGRVHHGFWRHHLCLAPWAYRVWRLTCPADE